VKNNKSASGNAVEEQTEETRLGTKNLSDGEEKGCQEGAKARGLGGGRTQREQGKRGGFDVNFECLPLARFSLRGGGRILWIKRKSGGLSKEARAAILKVYGMMRKN